MHEQVQSKVDLLRRLNSKEEQFKRLLPKSSGSKERTAGQVKQLLQGPLKELGQGALEVNRAIFTKQGD